ncbi:MAG: hypothetical protein LKJ47_08305, partial [Bifidobacteriaceae bacterium]|nr:hypothetical protein [Bifidobacteriaceae bacterium]
NNHKVAQNNALEFSNHHTTRSKTASPGSNPAAQAARKNYTQNTATTQIDFSERSNTKALAACRHTLRH